MRKAVFYYFKKSVLFFDLKVKSIPPAVFVIVLALNSLNFFVVQLNSESFNLLLTQYETLEGAVMPVQISYPAMAASLFIQLLISIVAFVYLIAAIRDAKNEEYTAKDCVNAAIKCLLPLAGVTVLKNILITAGLFLFIIPGVYIAIILIFAECTVFDNGAKTIESFRRSHALTGGRRGSIIKVELFCNLIILFFVILLLNFFSANNLYVFQYILIFVLSVCLLIEHKLVALLYADTLDSRGGQARIPAPPDTPNLNGARDTHDMNDTPDTRDMSDTRDTPNVGDTSEAPNVSDSPDTPGSPDNFGNDDDI